MATSYSLGCFDEQGRPIGDGIKIGTPRDRMFDPSKDSRFASALPMPGQITICNMELGLTHLRFAKGYTPKETDNFANSGSGMYFQPHTIVVEVGAVTQENVTIAARTFGPDSQYNQCSMPRSDESPTVAIASIIDIGCQKIERIVQEHPFIKDAVFITSDHVIYEAILNLEKWLQNGIPDAYNLLPVMELQFLHTNITALEAKQVRVLAWHVKPEYVVGPHWVAEGYFDDMKGVPPSADPCACPQCIMGAQSREASYARTGKEPCPCDPCRALIAKYGHLKTGEKFPFTNNAGIDAQLVMEADGPLVGQGEKSSKKE